MTRLGLPGSTAGVAEFDVALDRQASTSGWESSDGAAMDRLKNRPSRLRRWCAVFRVWQRN